MKYKFLFLLFLSISYCLSGQVTQEYLLLSDADITAQSYIGGKLKPKEKIQDALTIVRISEDNAINFYGIPLSNSALNRGKSVEISQDGKTAYVICTHEQLPDLTDTEETDSLSLPFGYSLFFVDISDRSRPKVMDTLKLGKYPASINLSPDGKQLAITVDEKHSEILLIPLKKDGFIGVFRHPHAIYSKEENIRATDISWHPSGKFLAVTLEEDKTVAFYKLISTDYGTRLALLGAPVEIGDLPAKTEFTTDGNFCLVNNLRSSLNLSEIVAIKFDEGGNHSVQSRIDVGRAAENFAISPKGQQIAVLNAEGSCFPIDSTGYTAYSSISLLSLSEQGILQYLDNQRFKGVLPKGLSYDSSGKKIAVAVYDYEGEDKGGLEFWEIGIDDKLKQLPRKIRTAQGTHLVKQLH